MLAAHQNLEQCAVLARQRDELVDALRRNGAVLPLALVASTLRPQ